jgi:hypothetical protein
MFMPLKILWIFLAALRETNFSPAKPQSIFEIAYA